MKPRREDIARNAATKALASGMSVAKAVALFQIETPLALSEGRSENGESA